MEIDVARYIPKKLSLLFPSFEDFKKDIHAPIHMNSTQPLNTIKNRQEEYHTNTSIQSECYILHVGAV